MTTASKGATTSADVVVIGSGIAGGMSAAVSAAQTAVEDGGGGRVILIDRATKAEAGGLTKWTSAYLRIDDVYEPGESFVPPDIVEFSDGRTPPQWYVEELAERFPKPWNGSRLSASGSSGCDLFHQQLPQTASARRRGGRSPAQALQPEAERLGVETRYNTTAHRLVLGQDGAVTGGVEVAGPDGPETVYAGASSSPPAASRGGTRTFWRANSDPRNRSSRSLQACTSTAARASPWPWTSVRHAR